MYKFERYRQIGLADFNQPFGLKMNPENRWVKKAETIPWDAIEERYAKLFPSKTGMPAKPLRTALALCSFKSSLVFLTGGWLKRSRKIRICNTLSVCRDSRQCRRLCPLCSLNFVSV